MSWKNPQEWLQNADLPFRHIFASCSDLLTFSDVYPHFFDYLFRIARNFIIIDNIPETVYKPFAMATLIINGKLSFFRRSNGEETNGQLVALNCAQAAEPDLYYVPSKVLVVNPRFIGGESYNLTPGVDCEVVYCTSQDMYRYGVATGGLYSLIDLTARLLTDNILSLNVAQKNMRLTTAFAADDEITKMSLEEALRAMYEGQPYKVVQKTLVDDIAQLPLQSSNAQQTLLQLLEAHKYILSEFYAAIGIDEPQQMKRERLVTAEVEQGAELPMFNVYDIFESIKEGIERVNKKFGTEMSVRINPLLIEALEGTAPEDAETEEENASDSEPAEISAELAGGSEEDTPDAAAATSADATQTEEAAQPDPDPEETEAETVTEAAAEIIEAAAQIIQMEEGGADNADESGDSRQTGTLREDSDSSAD